MYIAITRQQLGDNFKGSAGDFVNYLEKENEGKATVIPCLKTVVSITSGNYRNGKTQQPELIFEKYILPYLEK